jgi:hypothetical protein
MLPRRYHRSSSTVPGLAALLLVLALPGLSAAFGFIDAIGHGTQLPCFYPRSLALGGAVSVGVDDEWALFLNPSRIPSTGDPSISVGAVYGGWREKVPVAGVVIQKGEDISFTPYAAAAMPLADGLAAAVGFCTVSIFDYTGANLITDNPFDPYIVTSTQFLDASGQLNEALAGMSYSLTDDIGLGLSGGLRFGSADILETDYEYEQDTTLISTYDRSWEESEFCWHAGVKADYGFGTAGLTYASETEHYPVRAAIGGMVLAEHLQNTRVGFEVEAFDPGDDVEYIARLMIENPTADFLNTLVSVSFTDGPICDRPALGFAVGFEMNWNPLTASVAYSYRSRSRNSQYGGLQYYDEFDDSATLLSAAVTYRL